MWTQRRFLVALLLVAVAGSAHAAPIQIGSAAALGANDFFDWAQVRSLDGGGNAVAQSSPLNVTSDLGRSATLSDGGSLSGLVEGTDWFGDFLPADAVLYSGDVNDPFAAASAFAIAFATPVRGVGLQLSSGAFFDFDASLELFNGAASLGVFTVSGSLLGAEDGSAPFLGALSDSADVTRAVFTLTSNTDLGVGVNRLLTADAGGDTSSTGTPVPEPATLALLAIGGGAALAKRRERPLR